MMTGFAGRPSRFRRLIDSGRNGSDVTDEALADVLHVVLLADDVHPANVVRDHIGAFTRHSRHVVSVLNPRRLDDPRAISGVAADVLLIHYSLYILGDSYLGVQWRSYIQAFNGPVVLIIEDEYRTVNAIMARMVELRVDGVISCLDTPQTLENVYGAYPFEQTRFFCGLPGYVADSYWQFSGPPVRDRPVDIVYRGRTLPFQLGRHAREKRRIGELVASVAPSFGLKVDISSEESGRIYGADWPRFLQSGKAMLGVEGGASIFDFDGSLEQAVDVYRKEHPDAEFEQVWREILAPYEGNVNFKTITPKFFEAIAAGTALVLFPGEYNGVLQAHRHYIPLEPDGSNMAQVASSLRDHESLQRMVDRAREEVLARPDLSEGAYVSAIDRVVEELHEDHSEVLDDAKGNASGKASSAFKRRRAKPGQERLLLMVLSRIGEVEMDVARLRTDIEQVQRSQGESVRNELSGEFSRFSDSLQAQGRSLAELHERVHAVQCDVRRGSLLDDLAALRRRIRWRVLRSGKPR